MTILRNIIFHDVFHAYIINYLSYKDIKILQWIYPDLKYELGNYSQKIIINTINDKLSAIFGSNYLEFAIILKSYNTIIAGSFILQCIIGENWSDSDIDIFIPIKFIDNTYQTEIDNYLKIYTNRCDLKYTIYKYVISDKIYCVRDYLLDNKYKIQLIYVDITNDELTTFILEITDFNFCKSFYNLEQVYIANLTSVVNKQCKLNFTNNLKRSMIRYRKYLGRGFEFDINNDELYEKILNTHQLHICDTNSTEYSIDDYCVKFNYNGAIFFIDPCYNDCPIKLCQKSHLHLFQRISYSYYKYTMILITKN